MIIDGKKYPRIYPYRNGGFRVVAQEGRAFSKETTFPKGTKPKVMTTWQLDQEAEARKLDKPKPGSMLDELTGYLTRKEGRGFKGIKRREVDLRRMIGVLGPNKRRADITTPDIDAMIIKVKNMGCQGGRIGKRKAGGITAKVLDGATLNRNLMALQNFWTVLGGKSAANPVKDVERFPEEARKAKPKITHELFDRILAVMADYGGPAIKGQRRSEINLTRLRLKVIAFAGLPQQQIRELSREGIDWTESKVYIRRSKGKGLKGKWRTMGAFAMDAIRELVEAKGLTEDAADKKPFSSSSMYKSWCLARDKVEPGSVVTPYKLRHLFANVGLRASKDPAASSRILLHGVQATSAIYREEAEDEQDGTAWAAIDAWHRSQGRKLTYGSNVLDGGIGRKGLRRVK